MALLHLKETDIETLEVADPFVEGEIKEDELIAEQILKTQNVSEIKKLGKKVENYNEHVWNGIRQIVVYEGFKAIRYDTMERSKLAWICTYGGQKENRKIKYENFQQIKNIIRKFLTNKISTHIIIEKYLTS